VKWAAVSLGLIMLSMAVWGRGSHHAARPQIVKGLRVHDVGTKHQEKSKLSQFETAFAAEAGEIARNSWSQAVTLSRAGGDVVVHGHFARVTYLRHCGVVALISKPHYHS
jgi:hypothetical protein